MRTLIRALRYGLRVLRGSRGFTAAAVLTLALAIAASTTVFSWIDAVLLRPLPKMAAVPEPLKRMRAGQPRRHGSVAAIMDVCANEFLLQVLQGTADANVRFEDLRSLLRSLGFDERIRGDHHIFSKAGVAEILNLQPRGSLAKPYQIKQVRQVIVKYKLSEGAE